MKRLTAKRLARVILRYQRRKDQLALHCVLDDCNFEHKFFDVESEQDALALKDWSAARLIRLMRSMSRTQRVKAIVIAREDARQRERMAPKDVPLERIVTTEADGTVRFIERQPLKVLRVFWD